MKAGQKGSRNSKRLGAGEEEKRNKTGRREKSRSNWYCWIDEKAG